MNDLEHDLRELFDGRAAGVDVPGLAPKQVLKRGRRRQVGTVVTGVVVCVVALGVAAAAIGEARHPAVVPGGNDLPARTTSIGGVPVTAPAGWTLVDDYPLALVLATSSETCTFTGSGSAVEGNGSPVQGSGTPVSGPRGEGSGTSTKTCTGSTKDFPAGIPIFQMANFELPLGQSVCGQGNYMDQAALPPDGVAVYIASFPGGIKTQDVIDACPGAGNITDGVSLETFADRSVQTVYGGVVVAGSAASQGDIAEAQTYLKSLGGIRIDATVPPTGPGPGYVMAAGNGGGTAWRLEAGLTSMGTEGGPGLGAIMVTTDADGTKARTVDLPAQQSIAGDSVDLGGSGVVQFGTAAAGVAGVDIALPSGGTVAATTLTWPTQIASSVDAPSSDGWIWYAATPERGSPQVHIVSEPSSSRGPVPGGLRTFTDGNGFYTVFGTAFGHQWSFQQQQGSEFLLSVDGKQQDGYALTPGGSTQIDIPGGTLVLAFEPPSVKKFYVTSDAGGADVVANGAWVRSADYTKPQGHIWVVPLTGSGRGYEWTGDRLPVAIDWPTPSTPTAGDLIAAGSTPTVSWAETWSDRGCPTFEVVASVGEGDLGSSPCPVPWNPQEYANRPSHIGGVYGQSHATVWMLGPAGMLADVTSPDDPKAGGNCGGSIANEGPWAQTGECIFVIPVGQTYVIHPTLQDGTPLDQTITITAEPGRIKTSQTGGSPSPSP